MDGYLLYIYVLLKLQTTKVVLYHLNARNFLYESIIDFTQINGKVCISWSLYRDQLRIACKADKIVFSVTIYNPSGNEVAHCLLPHPKSTCQSHDIMNNITQEISSGETVFFVKRDLNDHLLNGVWRCVHGSQNENASVDVEVPETLGYEISPKITLSGPKYVKTKQKISLLCTSNIDPKDSVVSFQVNDQFYTSISKNTSGCFMESTVCPSDVCQCFSDGRSFTMQYFAGLESRVLSFRCSTIIKNFGTLSDCLFVTVVDIRGPFISFDTEFPLSAGNIVEITCKAVSRDYLIEITMNCLETVIETNKSDNHDAYVVKLSKQVTSSDNGTICSCKASSFITTSSSIALPIIRAPILTTIENVNCNHTEPVILQCQVSGELSEFGFSPWEHQFYRTNIRYVTGNITGNASFLSIDSCTYEDTGEYICKAWNQDSQQRYYQTKSISVIVTGPPVVVDNFITMATTVTLSAKFLSMQRPHIPKWFHKHKQLPKSTKFSQNMSKDVLVIRMYGKILTHNGYIANLTMVNEDYGLFEYLLLLENDYGTAKLKFELNNGSDVLNEKPFSWISLVAFLFLVSIVISIIFIYRHRRNSQRLVTSRAIYFAAPAQLNDVNIYNEATSHYEEIDDDYLVPEIADSYETSVKDETEDDQEENNDHYLELE